MSLKAVRYVFQDGKLDRSFKEALAFAASLAAKSDYGIELHLKEAKRLALTDNGVMEAVQVVQLFSAYTKIADGLRLDPDFDSVISVGRDREE